MRKTLGLRSVYGTRIELLVNSALLTRLFDSVGKYPRVVMYLNIAAPAISLYPPINPSTQQPQERVSHK